MIDYSHDLKVIHFRKEKRKTMVLRNHEPARLRHGPQKFAEISHRGCDLVPHVCRGYARFRNPRAFRPGQTFYLTVRDLI